MSREKKIRCVCGMRITTWQQPFHERSTWHRNWELIRRCVEAGMNNAQIAGAIGASSAYVSTRLRQMNKK